MEPEYTNADWAWLDVYTRSKSGGVINWNFRKRVARKGDASFDDMRVQIARLLGQSPAVPMSFDDFKLVKRP